MLNLSKTQISKAIVNGSTCVTARVKRTPIFMLKRVKLELPPLGHVGILCITDKQFGDMELFNGKKAAEKKGQVQQLELF